ncbi:Trk system potassium transporter TrkA [Kineobactrum salinum]|uniref:Trk system potassium uptake protein TrkA n=1 Tax=Kineobactrum salinum TaxID=2708301 RepID=A0A6C0TXL6_9GAMM|nr:Trk system potassium transporter TrkA [Kineobactrum salinum]QIB64273.1 Trk system potassium transporter TrkA [Kineobactrum salinum]
MNIIILGAGQVGITVAQRLAGEDNDITLVDREAGLLRQLQEHMDIRTVAGHAAHPAVLSKAGIDDADLLLAVTGSDETNMLACQIGHSLFHTPMRLARVRSPDYQRYPALFGPGGIAVDVLINPDELVTHYVHRLIQHPGALRILDFAGGRVQLVATRIDSRSPAAGLPLRPYAGPDNARRGAVVALLRRDRLIVPADDTVAESGDELFFAARASDVTAILGSFCCTERRNRQITIAGGSNIGIRLAAMLERNYKVTVIEKDPARCRILAESLHHSVILQGDAGDARLLASAEIGATDLFCALGHDDENNILGAMLARRLGARQTLCIVNRSSHLDLARDSAIDITISPAQLSIGGLLTHIRHGDVAAVHSLRGGMAEAVEMVARGNRRTSSVVGRTAAALPLPAEVAVAAIVRKNRIIFPLQDSVIEADDHIILMLADRSAVAAIERLFQVGGRLS